MISRSAAHMIAQTICECDGRDWITITSADRDRYARIGCLAEDRIRQALLDGEAGVQFGVDLLGLREKLVCFSPGNKLATKN